MGKGIVVCCVVPLDLAKALGVVAWVPIDVVQRLNLGLAVAEIVVG
jgi:hypothetical protein